VIRGVRSLLVLALCAGCGGPGELSVRDAHVVPPPGGSGPAGGFAVIENGTRRERTLLGAASPACASVELHRSWIEDGIARMAPAEHATIPADGTLRLEPGGLHLMLLEPCRLEGESVPLTLELDGGETLTVEAGIRAGGGVHDAAHAHDH